MFGLFEINVVCYKAYILSILMISIKLTVFARLTHVVLWNLYEKKEKVTSVTKSQVSQTNSQIIGV